MPRNYKQITKEERDRLSLYRAQGKSLRCIASLVGRNVSTISRELKRNTAPINDYYLPHKAQERADARKARAHERQRLRNPHLRRYVTRMLRRGWSPERIAGRWKLLGRKPISHEAIYQWIYADARNLAPFLARAHRRRLRRGHSRKHRTVHIPSRTPLSERPAEVALRQQAGHWEGDTIIGQRSQSALQALVERKTRFVRLAKLRAKNATAVKKTIGRMLAAYKQDLRRTITYDNGPENAAHLEINQRLGMRSYFCEPMRSWEKGSVENVVGLVRRRLPKKTDFRMLSPAQIKKIEQWINGLPRKCLGYRTAAEAFRSVALTS